MSEKLSILEARCQNLYQPGNRDTRNHWHPDARALYWYPYNLTFEELRAVLSPGAEISVEYPILYIGNGIVKWENFDLRRADRVTDFGNYSVPPGKSGHLMFTANKSIACGGVFDRGPRRQDHLYVASQEGLNQIGWRVFYAPTENAPLHVRMVHESYIENPDIHLPPYQARVAIAELFASGKLIWVGGPVRTRT